MGPHNSGVEEENPLPRPPAHASSDKAQDMVNFLGCKHTSMAHILIFTHQHPQGILCRAILDPFSIQSAALGLVNMSRVHPHRVRGLPSAPRWPSVSSPVYCQCEAQLNHKPRLLATHVFQSSSWCSSLPSTLLVTVLYEGFSHQEMNMPLAPASPELSTQPRALQNARLALHPSSRKARGF